MPISAESARLLIFVLLLYLALISAISVIACIYDKTISKENKVELRVPERTLMLLSVLGGSVAMLVTMRLIRHKTRHMKFMLGIPLIIVVQIALAIVLMYALR